VHQIAVIGQDDDVSRRLKRALGASSAKTAADEGAQGEPSCAVVWVAPGLSGGPIAGGAGALDPFRGALGPRPVADAIIVLTTAAAYGAWPGNPVPLTEDAPLRPNPAVHHAIVSAEAERLVAETLSRAEAPALGETRARICVLRVAPVVGAGDGWLGRALSEPPPFDPAVPEPLRQFVHVDDVAAAVSHALERGLSGVFNVAPDGWLTADEVRGLSGRRAWLPALPFRRQVAEVAAAAVSTLGLSDAQPALLPLLEQPWVLANDRLRATGWEPRYSNEEALVAARPGSTWQEMGTQRRQAVTMLAAAGLIGGAGATIGAVVRQRRRRR
jgi:nucleoside-diphosphate-sugar epimerase